MLQECPIALKDILIKMLAIRPDERPSAEEGSLHPYISQEDYQSCIMDENIDDLLL